MFTKQHYEAIAQIIRESTCKTSNPDFEYISKHDLTIKLADMFNEDNERFQRIKFLVACYKEVK